MKRNQGFQSNRKSNSKPRRITLKDFRAMKKFEGHQISLADAYEIVGGYLPADKKTFERAVKILRDNKADEEFVSLLVDMHEHNTSFKETNPDVYAKNLQTAYSVLNHHEQHEENVLARAEVREALDSTVIQGRDGEIVGEDRQKMEHVIASTAVAETAGHIVSSPEIVDNSEENIDAMIADRTRVIVGMERAEADVTKENKTSFKDRLCKAFNFKECVSINGDKLIARFNKAKKTVQASIENATKSAYKEVKIAANKCRKVAAVFLAAVTLTASISSCRPNVNSNDKGKAFIEAVDSMAPEAPAPEPEADKEVKAEVADTIAVPTEYSADMMLPRGAWSFDNVKKYYGERFGQAYKNIPDSLLTNGEVTVTRMQFLNQLRGHNEMNTPGAEDVVKALTPCDGEQYNLSKDDVAFIFTPIPQGNREVIATGLTYDDCNPTRHYKKVVKAPVVEENVAPTDTLNNDTINITNGAGEVRVNVDTTTVYTPSEVLSAQKEKSNVNNKGNINDTQVLGDVSVQKVLNVKVDGKNIKVEKTDAPVSSPKTQDANDVSVVFMKGNENLFEVLDTASVDDVLDVKVDANKTIKTSGTAASVATDANKPASQSTTSTFTSEGETFTFDDVDSTLVSSPVTIEQSDSTLNNSASTFVADNQDDSFEIVIGTENADLGAPSAGYVDERGGYENTGLSKSVLETDKKYFEDKYGKGAYDAYVETLSSHPELFDNGAAFGGWVPEQAIHAWRATEKWADNDIENKNADSKMVAVNVTMENFVDNKCDKDSLTAGEQSLMLEVFDRVTTTGRIFGVNGNKAVWNPTLRANDDCDTPSTRVIEQTNGTSTGPQGKMMPRIFVKDMPITVNEGQGEILVNTFVDQNEVASQIVGAQYEKTNEDPNKDVTVKRQATAKEVVGVKVNQNKRVKVQRTLADVRREHGRH